MEAASNRHDRGQAGGHGGSSLISEHGPVGHATVVLARYVNAEILLQITAKTEKCSKTNVIQMQHEQCA